MSIETRILNYLDEFPGSTEIQISSNLGTNLLDATFALAELLIEEKIHCVEGCHFFPNGAQP